ncbi:Hypothetical protein SMAX5B_011504 [Scophthalmus maximus]|uniref:Uncharacterized protein n=1 Tax=Scophthalmus maximus TaxID=52904 RepID=A0A2U9BNW5_SCOMX|nr:Hypothetical protein SMAX5B_011504 [Scophthalmus maximus]
MKRRVGPSVNLPVRLYGLLLSVDKEREGDVSAVISEANEELTNHRAIWNTRGESWRARGVR